MASKQEPAATVRRATTPDVERLARQGAQLVEVLPVSSFRTEHLPGAISLPLAQLDRQRVAELDPDRPVVVYCYDTECDLSARGAALLAQHGFTDVYDYTGSKAAWLAMGLPAEGATAPAQRAGAVARPAATCAPSTRVTDLPPPGPGGVVVVVDDHSVVLGAIRPDAVAGSSATALDVLQPAPPTVRPSITVDELADSMRKDGQHHVIVSTLDGRLLGIVERSDLDVDR